jgi:predicted phosphate transport protein (TIGR00153 family)
VRLIPRDEKFFDMFAELATRLSGTAHLIGQLFADPARLEEHASAIKKLEHEADHLTHKVVSRIDKSFVTPIDREDIHMLATSLDDVIDLIDGAARRAEMYRIRETREPAKALCGVLARCADRISAGVSGMKKASVVSEANRDVKKLEEEGDAIYHDAVGALFVGTPDPLEVIKWKDIYDKLEDAIDRCEDVANVLESIALKHA